MFSEQDWLTINIVEWIRSTLGDVSYFVPKLSRRWCHKCHLPVPRRRNCIRVETYIRKRIRFFISPIFFFQNTRWDCNIEKDIRFSKAVPFLTLRTVLVVGSIAILRELLNESEQFLFLLLSSSVGSDFILNRSVPNSLSWKIYGPLHAWIRTPTSKWTVNVFMWDWSALSFYDLR